MNMFPYTDVAAFIVRFAIFLMILSGYPLMHYFVIKLLESLLYPYSKMSRAVEVIFGFSLNLAGLMLTIFYPNVGSVLSKTGAVAGFLIIYTIPVLVHLSQMKAKLIQWCGNTSFSEIEASITYEQDEFEK